MKSNQDGAKPSSPIVDAIRNSVDSVVTSLFGVTGPQTRQATRTASQSNSLQSAKPAAVTIVSSVVKESTHRSGTTLA